MKRSPWEVLIWLLIIDLPIAMVWGWLGGGSALISSQVAFWSAALVVAASFRSYRRMVRARLDAGAVVGEDNRDTLDRIEDPYELYDEEEQDVEQEIREVIRAEKRRQKQRRRSALDTARDARAAFSVFRLGAYGILAAGFLWLRATHLLKLEAYLPSLALPIAVTIVWLMRRGETA